LKLLFIDNFDSFTYNVVHLLAMAGATVSVILNDDDRLQAPLVGAYDAVVLGPGPGNPSAVPALSRALGLAIARRLPVFGVCLGLQAIGEYFGATVAHAPQVMHGKTSEIFHDGTGLFAGITSPFSATRYHSLCVVGSTVPQALRVTATSEDGVVQGLTHRTLPIHGVQFHPESVLSQCGHELVRNFLLLANLDKHGAR